MLSNGWSGRTCFKTIRFSSVRSVVSFFNLTHGMRRNSVLPSVRTGRQQGSGNNANAITGGNPMALKKRGKTWHAHFFVDGQRFRQSLDTSDYREAQKREKELITQASQGKLAPVSQ